MTTPESPAEDLQTMPLEQMQHTLVAAGWTHPEAGHPEEGFGGFYRSYPRVNELLLGNDWRRHVFDLSDVIRQRAPWLDGGMSIGRWGDDTEAGVEVGGKFGNRQAATQAMIADRYLREVGFEEVDERCLNEWLVMKGEPGQPRPRTVAFFEQSERALAIRSLTIPLIHDYRAAVLGEGAYDEVVGRMLDVSQQLTELGVAPGMHESARPVAFMDPAVRAERVAGLIRATLRDGIGLSGGALARLQEHDMTAGRGPVAAIDVHADPGTTMQAMLLLRLEGMLEELAADEDGTV